MRTAATVNMAEQLGFSYPAVGVLPGSKTSAPSPAGQVRLYGASGDDDWVGFFQ
jgi:hypothetical protein